MADESKGKGKASAPSSSNATPASESQATPSNGNSGGGSKAAQSLASALRSSMASSQLGSLMQSVSGGKEGFQGPSATGGGELRDWLVQDMRTAPTASGSSSGGGSRVGGFRTQSSGQAEGEKMFDDFQRALTLDNGQAEGRVGGGEMEQSWTAAQHRGVEWQTTGLDPTTAKPLHSYTELDEPLHTSVQNDHRLNHNVPSVIHAQRVPPPAVAAPLAQSDDIFALLDAEQQQAPHPETSAPTSAVPHTADTDANASISQFDTHYRPPSPTHPSFTREQAALHLALSETHLSDQSQQDLLLPLPDNPSLQEGVYAPTPEAALSSILNPSGRTESTDIAETQVQERGREVVKKITKYFGATSYIDDVYGVSPVLRETIEEVVKKDNTEENRLKAVSRLESLWGHLSNTKPSEGEAGRGAEWVDNWLLKNT